jgi:type IV pilus assembly protein PilA
MMKDLLKKLQKKSNKKGFTLVEIIVVLVILAILAAIAVPSVLGYVNEAKEERYIQEAHSIYAVIQTEEAKAEALGEKPGYTAEGICKKAKDMTKLTVKSITANAEKKDESSGKVTKANYVVNWVSDDGKTIQATITKNNDVKITSKSK